MPSAYSSFAKKTTQTPQNEVIPGREADMTKNNAGGFVFSIGPLSQFRRFLILGTEGGTYYCKEKDITKQNATVATSLFSGPQGPEAVKVLHEVSTEGLAPKVSATIFALALAFASGTRETKNEAEKVFNEVIRTHSHLLEFVSYADQLRSWGRQLRRTVANWYNSKNVDQLGYQLAKYRTRKTWSARDVLRMAHPKAPSEQHNELYRWVVGKYEEPTSGLPSIVEGHQNAFSLGDEATSTVKRAVIEEYKLTHEMVPNTWLNDPGVWESFLPNMPATALIRNLGKMSSIGLLAPGSNATKFVVSRLHDQEYLDRNRVHPFNVLLALMVYKQGLGVKGELFWNPVTKIIDALDDTFYSCFKYVEPTGKRFLLAMDISGSMDMTIAGTFITAAQASFAMAMSIARSEDEYEVVGFNTNLTPFNISPRQRLDDIVIPTWTGGGTDCAKPMIWAKQNKKVFDTFVVFTDNETWFGNIHPSQALKDYRKDINPGAKLIVSAMASTGFSIADPKDPGMLDIVGLDSSLPTLVSNFAAGKV